MGGLPSSPPETVQPAASGARPALAGGTYRVPLVSVEVLSQRALNRALLARQGLLERSDASATEMIERLVGMQAQEPENPYVALFDRLRDFDPEQLSELIDRRRAVRAPLLRTTIHLVTARDALALHPLTATLRARTFKSPWLAKLNGADVEEVVAAGLALIEQEPRTRAELSAQLAPRWPDADPLALAYAVTFYAPLVQVPPRGLWGSSGQARWAHVESWLDAPLDPDPSLEPFVLRYLAAFGPASPSDVRSWAGVTGLRQVIERLRPRLRTFADEHGRELLDVLDGLLPDPGTHAPPRFLPEYDNVALGHADRARLFDGSGPGAPFFTGKWIGTLLVDGFYRANWKAEQAGGEATLTIDRFTSLTGDPATTVGEIEAEAERLLAFALPDASRRSVRFVPDV